MGYQETYLFLEKEASEDDVEKIILRAFSEGYYLEHGVAPVLKITFPEDFPDITLKGLRAYYFVGERHIQRKVTTLLNLRSEDDIPPFVWGEFTESRSPEHIWEGNILVHKEELTEDYWMKKFTEGRTQLND